jgi:hypothetical protein
MARIQEELLKLGVDPYDQAGTNPIFTPNFDGN